MKTAPAQCKVKMIPKRARAASATLRISMGPGNAEFCSEEGSGVANETGPIKGLSGGEGWSVIRQGTGLRFEELFRRLAPTLTSFQTQILTLDVWRRENALFVAKLSMGLKNRMPVFLLFFE